MKRDQLPLIEKHESDLKKMLEFRRYAKLYGGHIRLGDELVSIEKIDELIEHLKFEIASFQSQAELKIIPKVDD